jgi:hypothetical protein
VWRRTTTIRRTPAVGKSRAFGRQQTRSVTFVIVRVTGRQLTGFITPGFLQRRDHPMKVFTTIAWTAVVLVLLAAYLVALTKLRMVEFRADARGGASGALTDFNQVMPRGLGLPAHAQARWPVRGLYPNMGPRSNPAFIARGEPLR